MLKLLIVDDEKRTRDGLKKCLPSKSLGIGMVEEADGGTTALVVAERLEPDIIISDIRMPDMEGIEFVQQIRQKLSGCKVIFISGYSDKEYLKSAIQLKVLSYIEKPVNRDELKSAVLDAVNLCLQDRETSENSRKLEESRPILMQELVLYLTEPVCSRPVLQKKLSLAALDYNIDGYYVAVVFRFVIINALSAAESAAHKNNFTDYINSIFSDYKIKSMYGMKDEMHVLAYVSITSDTNLTAVKKALEELASNFDSWAVGNGISNLELSIGLGTPVQGMEQLYRSYQLAFLAEQQSFFTGMGKVLCYENRTKAAFVFNQSDEELFAKLLSGDDAPNLTVMVQKLFNDIEKHGNTVVHNIRSFFYRLLLILWAEADKRNIDLYAESDSKELLWSDLLIFNTLDQLKSYFTRKLEEYFHQLNQKSDKSKVVYEIILYIHRNFHQYDLDLESISNYIHLTPVYLCQVFKKETGKTINEYLTEYRMERAKDFLKEGRNKLYEISSDVGYRDTKYFIKTFRKKTGMTPSEYREKF